MNDIILNGITGVHREVEESETRWIFTATEATLDAVWQRIHDAIEALWKRFQAVGGMQIPSQGELDYEERRWAWGYVRNFGELQVEVDKDNGVFVIVLENRRAGEDGLDYTNKEADELQWVEALSALREVLS